jgi:hypothetical protein
VQEDLGVTMYTPARCGGRRRVRPVGLARGGVTEQGPVASIILVADDEIKACEHGKEKLLELQESMTPVGGPFGGTELGPLGVGREGEGLVRHSLHGDAFAVSRRLHGDAFAVGRRKEKRSSSNSQRELGELNGLNQTTLGTALDACGRSGPRWTSDA